METQESQIAGVLAAFRKFCSASGVWRHGDWMRIAPRSGAIIWTLSATSCRRQHPTPRRSELYRAVEEFPRSPRQHGGGRAGTWPRHFRTLFVVLRPGRSQRRPQGPAGGARPEMAIVTPRASGSSGWTNRTDRQKFLELPVKTRVLQRVRSISTRWRTKRPVTTLRFAKRFQDSSAARLRIENAVQDFPSKLPVLSGTAWMFTNRVDTLLRYESANGCDHARTSMGFRWRYWVGCRDGYVAITFHSSMRIEFGSARDTANQTKHISLAIVKQALGWAFTLVWVDTRFGNEETRARRRPIAGSEAESFYVAFCGSWRRAGSSAFAVQSTRIEALCQKISKRPAVRMPSMEG